MARNQLVASFTESIFELVRVHVGVLVHYFFKNTVPYSFVYFIITGVVIDKIAKVNHAV